MASWQFEQMDTIRKLLLVNHVLMIHDYSENYQCSSAEELQSEYFGRPEISLHITILYCHPLFLLDSPVDSDENTNIITAHIITVLDDA